MADTGQVTIAPDLLAALISKSYLRQNPIVSVVQVASTAILDYQPKRLSWLLVNLSVNNGFVGWDDQVSAAKGVFVAGNGGSLSASRFEDGLLVTRPVFALNAVALGIWFIVDVLAVD
jgi:hypothetical protein